MCCGQFHLHIISESTPDIVYTYVPQYLLACPNSVGCIEVTYADHTKYLWSEDKVLGGVCSLGGGGHHQVKDTSFIHWIHTLRRREGRTQCQKKQASLNAIVNLPTQT